MVKELPFPELLTFLKSFKISIYGQRITIFVYPFGKLSPQFIE